MYITYLSSRVHSMGSFDSLLLFVPLPYSSCQIIKPVPLVCTQSMNISVGWSTNAGVSVCWSPQDKVTYEFILTTTVAPCMFFSFFGWFIR